MVLALDDPSHAVDMAENQVTAQFRAHGQGTFQVEPGAGRPLRDSRQGQRLGSRFHLEPGAFGIPALGGNGMTGPAAGNRGADVDAVRIVGGPDPGPDPGRDLFDAQQLAKIGDNSGKHVRPRAV